MAVIENLDIVLGARTGPLDRGIDRSTGKVRGYATDVNRIGQAADATLAPLRDIGNQLLATVPGASAAATAFTAIVSAFSAGVTAKVAKDASATAASSAVAAADMTEFAAAAATAAVATDVIRRNASAIRLPNIGSNQLARFNPATAFAGSLQGTGDVIDAEFRVLSDVPGQASAASAAIGGISVAGIAAGAAVAGAFVVITGAAVGAIATLRGIRNEMGQIDEIAKSAAKSNVTFRELAGFRLAVGETSGLAPEAGDKALQKLQIRLAEAQRNGGALNDQLKSLGLDAGRLLRAGPLDALSQISAATLRMKSPTDQLVLAYRLFEEEGAALVSTLRAGPEAIQETQRAADQLGLSLSQSQVKAVEAANDAWGRTQLIATGVFRQLAAESAPVLKVIADEINAFAATFGGMSVTLPIVVDSLAAVSGILFDWVQLITATHRGLDQLRQFNFVGAAESFSAAVSFDTPFDLVNKLHAARAEAEAAAKSRQAGFLDLQALQAQEQAQLAAADAAKRAAEDRARTAAQNRRATAERLQGLRDEITALRQGRLAVERLQLARQGATAQQLQQFNVLSRQKERLEELNDAMERGKQLQQQFASPQQTLNAELADLRKLLSLGAIDFRTFAQAARAKAIELGSRNRPAANQQSFGALQKGSVEAFSASLRNDRAGQEQSLQEQGNALLEQVNETLARMLQHLNNIGTVGKAG